ncbi:hypothetical protein EFK50_17065 [Nocardioides marmoriginsengisoli]|uniref:CoA transferase n=1 Tax=Nocardioides marmoriginsengisoli TaxID=661483 RepID=A0A3N0CCB5_9ACTN|nr:CoA transferase [Nocardioides marmoriginsengisoli]RNL61090.1 hypothetical protein EFK50_17065 [Nocardioides marmoriginsengisoli]
MPPPGDLADWARSGAMALTGRPDGPPLVPAARPASIVREQLAALGLRIPGLLGERAAYAGLTRRGPWSCGGAMRILPAQDGHVALSLARPDDVALIPALVESDAADDPWAAIGSWAAGARALEIEQRMELLGLPGGAVRHGPGTRPAVLTSVHGTRSPGERPLVVDLTSLWAGPLCAHLLGRTGARVVKVESRTRPDGARSGPPDFFALLHDGHEQRTLDLAEEHDLEQLHALIREADLVLEASRPRALRHLGVVAEDVVAAGTSWLSITACGRASDAVGFGDDVAARAGLVVPDGDDLLPVGDAIADPVVGVRAAAEAVAALASPEAVLLDVSMVEVVAETRAPAPEHAVTRAGGRWWVEHAEGRDPVTDPERR